jgi:hypothetical protein
MVGVTLVSGVLGSKQRTGKSTGPEARVYLVCSRNGKERGREPWQMILGM